jgi:hypothetical protein
MAIFTIGTPDGRKLRIEAPDEATALQGAQEWAASQQSPPPSQAYTDALSAGSAASRKFGPPTSEIPAPKLNLLDSTAATVGGLVNGIPVVGPAIQNVSDAILGTGLQLAGQGTMQEYRAKAQEDRKRLQEQYPLAYISGQVGGSIASLGGLAAIPGGASALGLTGSLGQRVVAGGLSSAGLETADAAARGRDVASSGILGGLIGAGVPVVGAAVGAGARALGDKLAPIIGSATDAAGEASRRFGIALGRDASNGNVMSAADELVAAQNSIPLSNVDRGGEVTRALARSVANQSPEARSVLTKLADERFTSQAPRAVDFIRRIAGGAVDDLGYQAAIKKTAQAVNEPLYRAAYNDPAAKAVWTPEIRDLMQSPAFRSAISDAEKRGADRAAISGFKAVKNPFVFADDGTVSLRTLPDGSRALPSLQFWDQVKRNIDRAIGLGQRSGDDISDLVAIKTKLVSSLDAQVPSFKAARASAASYFGAEDALDAGKAFANNTRDLPEAQAAFSALKPAEKDAFRTGYASELIDKIQDGRFRSNVIDQAFGSPAKRELFETVFGSQKARQLEAYVRVEDLADKLRGSLGNSTTARQLVELGIGGGAGFALSGDWQGALAGAALAKGSRYVGEKVDARVMEELARLLTSGTRKDLDRAIANASISPKWLVALEQLGSALSVSARGAGLVASGGAALQE